MKTWNALAFGWWVVVTSKELDIIQMALDELGLALVGINHDWTLEQRKIYERATRVINKYKRKLDIGTTESPE